MRAICKGVEPESLILHRKSTHASYGNYADVQGLRQSLSNEQRGLCCYCLSRIFPVADRMKVEHWRPQSRFPDEQLVYGNLLGACLGNPDALQKNQHCDTRKGDASLSRNPANASHAIDDLVQYKPNGIVESKNAQLNQEINKVLNLNAAHLVGNRRTILTAFLQSLPKTGSIPSFTLQRMLKEWNGDDDQPELKEYCQIVVCYIKKRIRQQR